MLNLFLQTEIPAPWLVASIGAAGAILVALISGSITYVSMRRKTGADALKALTESGNMMAEALKVSRADMLAAAHTIERQDKDILRLGKLAAKGEADKERIKDAIDQITEIRARFEELRVAPCPPEVVMIITKKIDAANAELSKVDKILREE